MENKQQHIWWLFLEFRNKPEIYEFADWEASQLNTWEFTTVWEWKDKKKAHTEWTKVDARYKSNMAFKRAYCRALLKLVWLEDFYSSVEATDFEKDVKTWDDLDYAKL